MSVEIETVNFLYTSKGVLNKIKVLINSLDLSLLLQFLTRHQAHISGISQLDKQHFNENDLIRSNISRGGRRSAASGIKL